MQVLRTSFLALWVLIAVPNGLLVENVQCTVEALFWSVNPKLNVADKYIVTLFATVCASCSDGCISLNSLHNIVQLVQTVLESIIVYTHNHMGIVQGWGQDFDAFLVPHFI